MRKHVIREAGRRQEAREGKVGSPRPKHVSAPRDLHPGRATGPTTECRPRPLETPLGSIRSASSKEWNVRPFFSLLGFGSENQIRARGSLSGSI